MASSTHDALETSDSLLPARSPPPSNDSRYINCLPIEILSDIFALVPDNLVYIFSTLDATFCAATSPAGVLSRVCKDWREITRHTPALWASIVITGPRTLSRAAIWLAHSKHYGLDVALIPQTDQQEIIPRAFELLKPELSRVVSLTIQLARYEKINKCISALPDLPVLDSLIMRNVDLSNVKVLRHLLSSARSVRSLQLRSEEEPYFHPVVASLSIARANRLANVPMFNLENVVLSLNLPSILFFLLTARPEIRRFALLDRLLPRTSPDCIIFRPNGADAEQERDAARSLMLIFPFCTAVECLFIEGAGVEGTTLLLEALVGPGQCAPGKDSFALPNLRELYIKDCLDWSRSPEPMLSIIGRRYEDVRPDGSAVIPAPLERIALLGEMIVPAGLDELREVVGPMGTQVIVRLQPVLTE